jgi:lysozyme family protein
MTTEDIINAVLDREGGSYTDKAGDHGGPTKWGITLATLRDVRGAAATAADVKALTHSDAAAIYVVRFVHRPAFDQVADMRLRAELVDWGVNSGPAAPIRALQRAVGVPVDGVLGPASLGAVARADAAKLYLAVLAERLRFLGRLITDDPSQAQWAAGWLNRISYFVTA